MRDSWGLKSALNLLAGSFFLVICPLTHWHGDKMASIPQATCSNTFYWMKMILIGLKFPRNLFVMARYIYFYRPHLCNLLLPHDTTTDLLNCDRNLKSFHVSLNLHDKEWQQSGIRLIFNIINYFVKLVFFDPHANTQIPICLQSYRANLIIRMVW